MGAQAVAKDAMWARGGQMQLEQVLEERPPLKAPQLMTRNASPRHASPRHASPRHASPRSFLPGPLAAIASVPSSARNDQEQQVGAERDQKAAYEGNAGYSRCWSPRKCS